MKILCPLTAWETKVATKGIGRGNTITTRMAVAADPWNWVIGLQRDANVEAVATSKYYGNMKILLGAIFKDYGKEGVVSTVKAVLDRVGKTMELSEPKDIEEAEKLGTMVDDELGTSYMREYPPKVFKQIFKTDETDETPVEEPVEDNG